MTENFNILVDKLNLFRKKFYSFKLWKGLFISSFLILLVYTVLSVLEYVLYMRAETRKAVFFGFLIFSVLVLIQFLFIPLFRLLHFIKPIGNRESIRIIQNHFSEIEDKLLNIIELADIKNKTYSDDIILASIDQKIDQLKIYNFSDAVQYKNLRLVLLFFLVSFLTTFSVYLANKNIFTESANRIVHYNTPYSKPAPFSYTLENENLNVKKGDSFTLVVNTTGNEIPQILYVNIEGNSYLMKSRDYGLFEYEMVSVINPVKFYFTDLKYNSNEFSLNLLPKPGITFFQTMVKPPAYTGISRQVFENVGDLQIPAGTEVEWKFTGMDTDSLSVVLSDSTKLKAKKENKSFIVNGRFYESTGYNVFIQNSVTDPELALSYKIETIPDIFPEIDIVQINDSLQLTRYFFKGLIGDDYGFSDLSFHYNINNVDSVISIPVMKTVNEQEFYFSFDFKELNQKEGMVSYYFSVSDNDVINNYKTTTSESFTFEFPNKQELLANEKEKFDQIQKNFDDSRKLANEIQKDLNNLQIKNMDTNVSDWEKSQLVNDIVSKQNKLEKLYNQIKQENENLNNYLNSFNQPNEELREKQQQIEELLKEVFTDELKKLMEEFNKLAEEFNSKRLNELTNDMKLTYEDLQKQLDRNLEMLKKLKVQQGVQNVIDQLNQLADEEDKLAEEVSEDRNFEQAGEKIGEDQKNFQQLEKQLNDALKLNEDLKKPMNLDDFSEDFENTNQNFKEIKKEIEKKNRKKSESGIKQNSEKMKSMAFGLQQMLDANAKEENYENIENLRQILSNLIVLSFSQEDILTHLNGIADKDPALIKLNQDQKKIQDQSRIVRDSLYALGMRTPQITSMVNNELLSMEINLEKAASEMEEGLFPNARVSQQFTVTAFNNLALMLNEALENLEKQMAGSEGGDQECEKPGTGKPGMNLLKQASENIKQQLEKMIEQMKSGNPQNMSQQMGQSLMQHEMMQQMLRELMNNGTVGSDAKQQLQQIDNLLEQNRKELMSKSVDAQTLTRQNLITTRLLEAEKAEMEREFEEKRESKTADEFYSNPMKFFEYKERESFSIEFLNKNEHKLNGFYNSKYKKFLENINELK